MSSTVIDPVAQKLKLKIDATQTTVGGSPVNLKGYVWEPKDFDTLPAGTVMPPHVHRVGALDAEMQIGSNSWTFEFPVSLYFDLQEPLASQAQAVEGVEHFIAQVDADQTLGGTCVDAKVTECEVFIETSRNRMVLGYQCTVEVLKFV